jgi:hypothetical protein
MTLPHGTYRRQFRSGVVSTISRFSPNTFSQLAGGMLRKSW